MLTTKQLAGVRVYRAKERRNKEDKISRLGKVHQVVFAPDGHSIVGVTVRRPDIAGMIKQDDVFVALDRLAAYDKGLLVTDGDDTYDAAACKRLGIDWDSCFIWDGMDARTESGKELGYVGEVTFDSKTGKVGMFRITDGGMSNALVGCVEIPASMFRRYERGFLVVDDAAAHLDLSGGVAGKAGAAYGKAKIKAKEEGEKAKKAGEKVGKKAAAVAGDAFDKGTYGLGKVIGKARRAVTEAIQEDPDPEERKIEQARVEEPPRGLPEAPKKKPKKDKKDKKDGKKGTGKKKPKPAPASTAPKKGTSDSTEFADRMIGMFAEFKREFDESSK